MNINIEIDKIVEIKPCQAFLKVNIELSDYQAMQVIKLLTRKLAETSKENVNE